MPSQAQLPDRRACRQFYDQRYARGYMDDWPARRLERVREQIAALTLPRRGTAIDFGCGNGTFTAVLRDALPGWRIVGLDISPVALEHARRTVSGCRFHPIDEPPADAPGPQPPGAPACAAVEPHSVNFLFTHHVLEHVLDLDYTWERMNALMCASSCMLHVLPCGNPGSLEHELCRRRTDGIGPNGRHFYEDPGHLRRLRTQELSALAARFGYRLTQACYSYHRAEALDWLSGNGMRFVLDLCDPSKAIDARSRGELLRLRRQLLWMAAVKRVARGDGLWTRPLARWARAWAQRWARAGQHEWQQMRAQPDGSEMMLAFERGSLTTATA